MSIALGIYDVFSYFIPGVLYLFTINELLRIINWEFVDIASWIGHESSPGISLILAIFICAYVVGHILDPIANTFFVKFINRVRGLLPTSEMALHLERKLHPNLNIEFDAKDWFLLYNLISQRHIEVARAIDKYQADSIMLRNITFGAFLLACIELGGYFATYQIILLINSLVAILVVIFAYFRSMEFRLWYFSSIFEASLEYGLRLEDVISYNHKDRLRTAGKQVKKPNNKIKPSLTQREKISTRNSPSKK